jgi:hypothetical protein
LRGGIVGIRSQGRLMHEPADGEVSHQQPVEFLSHQVGCLAAQDDFGPAEMGFHFIEGGLYFPLRIPR